MWPLHFRTGHLFIEISEGLWLFDTGSPKSFGSVPALTLEGVEFELSDNYMGMTVETLSGFVSVECAGLLGADVLENFDFLMDTLTGNVRLSRDEFDFIGNSVTLDEFMGIPIVTTGIKSNEYRMFFDTGAQISYFQHGLLTEFPFTGEVEDFYPGFGQFQTKTYDVDICLGEGDFTLSCGTLPGLLGGTLMMAGVEGIIGNELLKDRRFGYFPRRNLLVL